MARAANTQPVCRAIGSCDSIAAHLHNRRRRARQAADSCSAFSARFESERLRVQTASRCSTACRAMIGLRRVFLRISHLPRKACQSNATAQTHPAPRIRSRFAAQWVLAIRLPLICTTDAGARVKPPTVVPHFLRRFMPERLRVQTASRCSTACRAMIGLRRVFSAHQPLPSLNACACRQHRDIA